MNKTLPEKIADILMQNFVAAFKKSNINSSKDMGLVTVRIEDSCKNDRTMIGRAVYIEVNGIEFSLAIDAPKEYYRPYKDSELDACIHKNIRIMLDNPQHVFITNEELIEFVKEMNAAMEQ